MSTAVKKSEEVRLASVPPVGERDPLPWFARTPAPGVPTWYHRHQWKNSRLRRFLRR